MPKTMDEWICEYMYYCRSRKLRPKTMNSYEQTLCLFERWLREARAEKKRKFWSSFTIVVLIIAILYLLFIDLPNPEYGFFHFKGIIEDAASRIHGDHTAVSGVKMIPWMMV